MRRLQALLLLIPTVASCTQTHHIPTDSLTHFQCRDTAIWSVDGDELVFTRGSTYTPPHRSPRAIALIDNPVTGSYAIEVEAMQTGRNYGHRDLCVFFDWLDPAHFGYVHLATEADPNSHHIQIVDAAARTPVTTNRTNGVDWGTNEWHDIRIERNVDTGTIRAFFDGTLVMEAVELRFGQGRVGLGSFDDQGRFRNLRISALR
jgi:hypothetical protein